MNIRHISSFLCLKTVIDSESNNLSAIDIFEQFEMKLTPEGAEAIKKINSKNPLVVPLEFNLVTHWMRDDLKKSSEGEIQVQFVDPSKNILFEKIFKPGFVENKRRLRVISKIDGLPFTGAGIYWMVVKLKGKSDKSWKTVAELPLDVRVQNKN